MSFEYDFTTKTDLFTLLKVLRKSQNLELYISSELVEGKCKKNKWPMPLILSLHHKGYQRKENA